MAPSILGLAGLGLLLGLRHAFEPDHLAAVSTLATRQARLVDACRLGFGLLHGLAGSGAILVLLVAAAPTRAAQLAYFVAFASGTVLGMLAVSLSLVAIVRLASRRGARWATLLHLGSAVTSVVVGLVLAGRVAGQF